MLLIEGDHLSLRDLIRINEPFIGKEEIDAVTDVLKSGFLTEKTGASPRVLEFERDFSSFVGSKYAIAVCSGTAALHAALLAAGVKMGDEVIVPSFTFSATANTVLLAGAKPVFADIDGETYNIKPENIEAALSRKTKAIIPVHLYGYPAEMHAISKIARQHDLTLIEDAAQAHGAVYKSRHVGTLGDMACFSFYAAKNMTTGEGGMITTNDDDFAEALRMIRAHGEAGPYRVVRLGHNYRMPEINAAIGNAQLKKLPNFIELRKKNAETLTEKLSTFGKLALPKEREDCKHAWYLYTVRLIGANAARRNRVVEKLRAKNIGATVYYETPVHLLPFYRESYGYGRGTLSETERAARQVFSLPVHPKVTTEDLEYMADILTKVIP